MDILVLLLLSTVLTTGVVYSFTWWAELPVKKLEEEAAPLQLPAARTLTGEELWQHTLPDK